MCEKNQRVNEISFYIFFFEKDGIYEKV